MDKTTIIKSAVNTLMTTFQSGNFPSQIATTFIRKHADDDIPSDKWTFANRLLMAAQGTNDARGYKQWQQVNRQVKRGSLAIHVFAPLTRKVTETDETTGEEMSRIILTGFRPIPVFRVEDTEGDIQRAVLERGVKVTGATAYFADADGRVGSIILQRAVEVKPDDTPETLGRRVLEEAEWRILSQAVGLYCAGKLSVRGNRVLIEK